MNFNYLKASWLVTLRSCLTLCLVCDTFACRGQRYPPSLIRPATAQAISVTHYSKRIHQTCRCSALHERGRESSIHQLEIVSLECTNLGLASDRFPSSHMDADIPTIAARSHVRNATHSQLINIMFGCLESGVCRAEVHELQTRLDS
jgi:hypothetical protein